MAIRRPKKPITKKVSPTKKSIVKKKAIGKKTSPNKRVVNKTLANQPPKISVKRRMYEYEKLAENANSALFTAMGKKVQEGEVKWAYYTTENDVGYHYYIKLKKK